MCILVKRRRKERKAISGFLIPSSFLLTMVVCKFTHGYTHAYLHSKILLLYIYLPPPFSLPFFFCLLIYIYVYTYIYISVCTPVYM